MSGAVPPRREADRLAEALVALRTLRARLEPLERARTEPIAIVGIGCRFPGATGPAAFWRLLRAGADAITDVPAERWDARRHTGSAPGRMPTARGGFIGDVAGFDPFFFGITPREAAAMDPQQRIVLEVAWEALEDAGIVPSTLAGTRTGVFLGIGLNDYGRLQVAAQERDPARIDTYTVSGNALCIAANRLSYLLDLRGPSMAIDTACSSSLVAVHQAVQSIRSGDSTVALAGGVNLMLAPANGIGIAHFLAPDGRCKAFDARADGYVRGEGAGWVVLKPLSRALADGDRVYALIRGSAVNQDGFSSGLTVPNGAAQEALLRAALANAQVAPADIDYVEAHGTGTALGDPIEANALAAVLSQDRPADRPCALGSVKTNIGHLEAAAGIAGLIKTALALHHREIPPSLHFDTPNPLIPFGEIPLAVQRTLAPWPAGRTPRAGVSSFGFGGTNAHVVLEAPPEQAYPALEPRGEELLVISARSERALRLQAEAWVVFLADETSDASPRAFCAAAALRRTAHSHRIAVTGSTRAELRERLRAAAAGETGTGSARGIVGREPPRVAFVFSGQGAQWHGMARTLLAHEPVFRATVEACDALLAPLAGWSVLDELRADEPASRLTRTDVAQPALFAVQAGLLALWKSWGVTPAAVVGHSVGEIAAAYAAGALSLEDAIRIVHHRGRIMQRATGHGRMASVQLTEAEARAEIVPYEGLVSIAAVNAPDSVVLSGETAALTSIVEALKARGVSTRPLPVDYAFHSPQMAPYEAELASALVELRPRDGTVAIVSTVTGTRIDGSALDAAYWGRNVVQPVRFRDAVEALLDDGITTFLEIAPHPVLAVSISATAEKRGVGVSVHASMRRGRDERATMLNALGGLYVNGQRVNWSALHERADARVAIPTYAWDRQRYWFEDATRPVSADSSVAALLGELVRSPAIDGVLFTSEVAAASSPLLADHRIGDTAVLPAAGIIALALEAAARASGEPWVRAEKVEILRPFAVPDGETRALQLVLTKAGDGALTFRLFGAERASAEAGEWTLHAQGRIERAVTEPAEDARIDEVRARCTHDIPAETHYARIAERGLSFGPTFRRITGIWAGTGEAVASLTPARERIDATLLDAALQVLDCVVPGDALFLPVTFESVQFNAVASGPLRSHARVRAGADDAEVVRADVDLVDESGTVVVSVRGVALKRAYGAALGVATQRDAWWHEVVWEARARETAPANGGRWLVLGDGDALARNLASALAARGAHVSKRASAELRDAATAQALWREAQSGGPVRGVVYVSPAAPDGSCAPEAAADTGCATLLHLVQALGAAGATPRVFVVTEDARARPDHAALHGFAAVVAAEHPELACTCVDVGAGVDIVDLCDELLSESADRFVALRDGERRVRAVRSKPDGELPENVQLVVARPGVFDGLRIVPGSRRAPGAGEVEIRAEYTGLNFRDVLNVLGRYPGDPPALGSEVAGTVARVGAGVTHVQPGDPVIAVTPDGAFRSFVTVPAALIVRAPRNVEPSAAAGLPIAYLTAAFALQRLAHVRAGDRVLIHAAAGGVGLAAVRIALAAGAEVFATAGSDEKRAYLGGLGVHHVLDSRSLSFAEEVRRLTDGRGVDIALNSLAGDFIDATLGVMAHGGRFIEIGKTGVADAEDVRLIRPDVAYHVLDVGTECATDPESAAALLGALVDDVESGRFEPLPVRTFPLAEASAAMRFMAQARHTGKLVVRQPHTDGVIRRDASYLVTGGFGGLGLTVASWLASRNAGAIVLMARGEPDAAARTRIEALVAAGADVRVVRGDVTREADVRVAVAACEATGKRLRGIVHAAGVTDDGAIARQTHERVSAVLAPKVRGAVLLDRVTADRPLDFFLLFSSIAPLIGSAGQAAYAAANAFLDAFAHGRHSRGLPATSINWGPWADAGMFARLADGVRQRWQANGITALSAEDATTMLDRIVHSDAVQVVAARFRRDAVDTRAPEAARPAAASEPAAAPLAERLRALPPVARRHRLEAHVREQVARVLGLAADHRLDAHQGLRALGMDSLMAVELRNRLQQTTGVPLASTIAFDHPTVTALCDHLADVLHLNNGNGATPHTNGASESAEDDEGAAELMAELDALRAAFTRRSGTDG